MKRLTMLLCTLFLMSGITGVANATLITIGTAGYDSDGTDGIEADEYYNLIWDDDNNGNSLVWLDFTNAPIFDEGYGTWYDQVDWADSLNNFGVLEIDLLDGYTVVWETNDEKTSSWRLPTTVDGIWEYGYDGDPDNDGVYSYTYGYNLANSEMGHLFYEELGNLGYLDTSGNSQSGWGLQNTGDFDNLTASWYWSGTEYADSTDFAWYFYMDDGYQSITHKNNPGYGLAVRSGQVSASSVPEPGTVFLLGLGLLGFSGLSRRKGRRV